MDDTGTLRARWRGDLSLGSSFDQLTEICKSVLQSPAWYDLGACDLITVCRVCIGLSGELALGDTWIKGGEKVEQLAEFCFMWKCDSIFISSVCPHFLCSPVSNLCSLTGLILYRRSQAVSRSSHSPYVVPTSFLRSIPNMM